MDFNGYGLMDLYAIQREVGQAIGKEQKRLLASVSVSKNEHGATILKHPANGSYIVKACAFRGRLRMWKMVQGVRGLKQGPCVVHEAIGDLDDLRIQVAFGHYKDKE